MTDNDYEVLRALADSGEEWCLPFDPICRDTELDRRTVRLSCRRLTRNGFAAFYKGLWTDEGMPAGAGYAITKEGRAKLEELGR